VSWPGAARCSRAVGTGPRAATLFGLVNAFTDMIVIFVLTRGGPYEVV
jgi:hypothetical protein